MTGRMTLRRTGALFVGAALVASLIAAAAAGPVGAAGNKCLGQNATHVGTVGDDTITGTPGADVIIGLGGDDRIFGLGGNDLICGGTGADLLVGNGGADRLVGNAGSDRIVGGVGPDRLFGGVGDDVLAGRNGNDLLDGGHGTDHCVQGAGTGPVVRCESLSAPPASKPNTDASPEWPARTGDTGGGQAQNNMQPFLTLTCLIATSGTFPSQSGGATDTTFLGEMTWFAGNFAPRGWAKCEGQLLPIAQHPNLFAILGTTYGGDGRTTFALPDARGRVIVGQGSGPDLSMRRLGEQGGLEGVRLTINQMPSHDHPIPR